jgi:hypothetical protein
LQLKLDEIVAEAVVTRLEQVNKVVYGKRRSEQYRWP